MSGRQKAAPPKLSMSALRKIRGNLQFRITSLFSLLLLASFAFLGFFFNFIVSRNITAEAGDALLHAKAAYGEASGERPFYARFLRGTDSVFARTVHHFEIDGAHAIVSDFYTVDAVSIAERMRGGGLPVEMTETARLRVGENVYYVAIAEGRAGAYAVFYVSATEVLEFAVLVNRLLLLLGGVVWLIAIVVSGVIADLLTRPVRKINDFVLQIGKGDFTPNDYRFASEEMQELNQSLNSAARQLAGYDNEQRTFFQNVSHDLRTPLMAIKSYSEGIKLGIMNPAEASKTIISATDKLTAMVDDIMYVSRLDSLSAPKMGRDNLSEIVAERIMQHRARAKSMGLNIKFSSSGGSLVIACVTQHIERLIDNLVGNAFRFARTWVKIEVSLVGNRVVLVVSDDGPGFEPSALPYVFERFFKGRNGITGIGLSIVKSIAEQHRATASAENGENGGAVLTVSFPKY